MFNREGGSIPVVATFQEELGLPCVLFGVGLPDENAHAPDEKLDLGNFHNGIIASAFLYGEIGSLGKQESSKFKKFKTLVSANTPLNDARPPRTRYLSATSKTVNCELV